MSYSIIRYFLSMFLLLPSIHYAAEKAQIVPSRSLLQSFKEKYKTFITDVNDPRSQIDLVQTLWYSKDPIEKKEIRRIVANKKLAELIALGLVIVPLWYIVGKTGAMPSSRTSHQSSQATPQKTPLELRQAESDLPLIQISDFMRDKLPYLKKVNDNIYDVFFVLNIPPTASIKTINTAFKQISKELHPDKSVKEIKPAIERRKKLEDLGIREISKEELKLRLAHKRNPKLGPAPELPSPPIEVSPEIKESYDEAFKALQKARDLAKDYVKNIR